MTRKKGWMRIASGLLSAVLFLTAPAAVFAEEAAPGAEAGETPAADAAAEAEETVENEGMPAGGETAEDQGAPAGEAASEDQGTPADEAASEDKGTPADEAAENGETAGGEAGLSSENLFDKTDPYFTEGYNFVQTTEELTEEPDSFMTGYIPVEPDTVIRINLNAPGQSELIKYATYDMDKVWKETVRVEYVSEVTFRIFEAGFIRISVVGKNFEDTITILKSADVAAPPENEDTYVLSSKNSNVMLELANEDMESYTTDVFDRNDPDIKDGYNFEANTNNIVEEPNSFITGYIQVDKGDAVVLNLNSDVPSPFVKYAFYDENKEWIKTVKLYIVPEVTVTANESGYIRFSVYNRFYKNNASIYIHPSLRLAADETIEEDILPTLSSTAGQLEAFYSTYLSGEEINLFDTNSPDFMMNYGFTQLTGEVVENEGSFLTGYIPVVSGQVVVISISEESEFAKYALYDKDRNWLGTTRVENPTMMVIPISETGYLRFHGYGKAIDGTVINIPSLTKLDINAISGNIENRLQKLEKETKTSNQVDVIIFMGQSNMAGRGEVTEDFPEDAPEVINGAGWEFRAITDPTSLHPISKYFGIDENVEGGINDGNSKTGGMIPSFVNAYYQHNGNIPVVGISASEGGTSINEWTAGSPRLNDAINRFDKCVKWLYDNGYDIRHKYMVWCQGENDGNHSEKWYGSHFRRMFNKMQKAGVEKCFMIRIGHSDPVQESRINIMNYQNHICKTDRDCVMISLILCSMLNRGLMKDNEHLYQQGYNETGEDAGLNMASYVTTGKEPMMYDPQFDELYFSSSY